MQKQIKEWTPDSLFEIINSYWKSCTFHAAIQLDIFSAIGKGSLSKKEIAEKLDLNQRALGMLLDALTAMELLVKEDNKYSNTPSGQSLLCKDSLDYIGYMALHHHNMVETWAQLAESVRTGKAIAAKIPQEPEGQEKWWQACIEGMLSLAVGYAQYLSENIDLSDKHNLLDLGGGPGTYAIHFCKSNPQLKATVLDVPSNKSLADRTIKRFGVEEQVSFLGADFNTVELEKKYDVVWISHVIHGESEENTQKLINKAVNCLKPGGKLMIHDYFMNDDMGGPLHPALFSLNMLLVTLEGKAYSISETKEMLEKAGVKNINHKSYEGELESSIIYGDI